MYIKTKCNICNHDYDALEPKCPYCEEKNNANPDAVKHNKTSVFPWWKQLVLFLTGWLGFQIIATIFMFFVGQFELEEVVQSAIINFGAYAILVIGMCLICWVDIKKLFVSFKGWKPYVFGIAGFAAIMIFTITWNQICLLFPLEVTENANQSTANNIVLEYPLLALVILGFVGPFCEELTYRVGLFHLTKRLNRVLGYVITLIVFAFIHFDFDAIILSARTGNWDNLWNELLNLPFYVFAGATFTFLYEKFGFASSLTAHVINNTYSVLATIILRKLISK